MSNIDNRYISTKSLTEYFVDKTTGKPITGGWVEFYKDNDRSSAKLVYQLSGSPPNYTFEALPNPVDISVGSLVNGDSPPVVITPYYFPYDENGDLELYYIKIYNQYSVLQKELEAWPPNVGDNVTPTNAGNIINNQVSNSQFVEVLFNENYGTTISISGPVSGMEVEIAPDWFLKISSNGVGSVVVNRNELAGSLNIETNPPYEISILPEGGNISELKLFQRFNHNPNIWASEYLAGGVLIASSDGVSHEVTMSYAPNISTSPTVIVFGETGSTGYTYLSNTILLGAGVNTDLPSVAYVDLVLSLPVNGGIRLTSVFLAGLDENDTVSYDQETVNRQKDNLFHYYQPLIQSVPVPSILQGWDFRVNPAQWGSNVSVGNNASTYLWDQLIGWQSAVNCLRAYRGNPQSLVLEHEAVNGQIAIIQYLSGAQLRQLLSNPFSVLMKGYTDLVGGASGTVSFWYTSDSSLPDVSPANYLSLISTIDANGKPATFHGNWTEITRNYRGDARFTIPYSNAGFSNQSPYQNIALEGWNQTPITSNETATFGAIVVGFELYSTLHNVVFESISCTPGALAVPFAPLDYANTLNQLQYYYEKSYPIDIYAGAPNANGFIIKNQSSVYGGSLDQINKLYTIPFTIEYRTTKRGNALSNLYSRSGQFNNVTSVIQIPTSANTSDLYIPDYWDNITLSNNGVEYYCLPKFTDKTISNPGGEIANAYISFHYVADARYGII